MNVYVYIYIVFVWGLILIWVGSWRGCVLYFENYFVCVCVVWLGVGVVWFILKLFCLFLCLLFGYGSFVLCVVCVVFECFCVVCYCVLKCEVFIFIDGLLFFGFKIWYFYCLIIFGDYRLIFKLKGCWG